MLPPTLQMPQQTQALPPALATWVPLWGQTGLAPWPANQPNPLRQERGWDKEKMVLLYSGNMGLGHCFREFLVAARRLGSQGPLWAFAGNGARRPEIEAFATANPRARIQLLPYAPANQLRQSLAAADVHLASLEPRWQGLMVPSKIQGIFQMGKPVIFVGGRENEIAGWILDSGAGWVVAPHDIPSLLQALDRASDPREREQRGLAALAYAQKHFDRELNLAQIAAYLEQCLACATQTRASAPLIPS